MMYDDLDHACDDLRDCRDCGEVHCPHDDCK